MTTLRNLCALGVILLSLPAARAQEGAKPGPEHDVLKKFVGNWGLTMKFGGMESKGTVSYKMDLGGLWLASEINAELFGAKFQGRGFDTYDAGKKKYVAYWFDSMGPGAVVTEGEFDKAKKTMTMSGEGPGMDGKPTKYKSVTVMPDDDNFTMTMYVGGGAEPAFTIAYKRRK
jgi:hypothetical protein